MKIKSIKKVKNEKPVKFYDITVDEYHNFPIGKSKIITHNSSLGSAINRLTRPYANSGQILEGDGFFGSAINPQAAAARYTSVKISKNTASIINEYKYLNSRDNSGNILPLHVNIPIGLQLPIIGIAVGYKTTILPRHPLHVKEYLKGNRKSCKPYFKNFNGKISKYKDFESTWLLEGEIEVINNKIYIKSLPPLTKYSTFLKKIDRLLENVDSSIKNESDSQANIVIEINIPEYQEIIDKIIKYTKLAVKEFIIFIKDSNVLEYRTIENYLDDFKYNNERVKLKVYEYYYKFYNEELNYLKAKQDFLLFMMAKKRTSNEIIRFYKRYNKQISIRLDNIKLRNLNTTALDVVGDEIEEFKIKIIKEYDNLNKQNKIVDSLPTELNTMITEEELFEFDDSIENDIEIYDIEDETDDE